MKETAFVLKGAKKILVPKEGFNAAINIIKKVGVICLGSGGLYMITELIRSNGKGAFSDIVESAAQIVNIAKNS